MYILPFSDLLERSSFKLLLIKPATLLKHLSFSLPSFSKQLLIALCNFLHSSFLLVFKFLQASGVSSLFCSFQACTIFLVAICFILSLHSILSVLFSFSSQS